MLQLGRLEQEFGGLSWPWRLQGAVLKLRSIFLVDLFKFGLLFVKSVRILNNLGHAVSGVQLGGLAILVVGRQVPRMLVA